MEQRDKKRRSGQNAAFYAALAVCLIAAGVGTWQLLQPEQAPSGTAAVSASGAAASVTAPSVTETPTDAPSATAPDAAAPSVTSPDAAAVSGASDETLQAVSGAAPSVTETSPGAAAASATSPGAAASSGTGAAKSDGGKSSGAKSNASDAKSGASGAKSNASGAKSGASGAKSGASGAKSNSANAAKSNADSAKAESGKSASGDAVRPVEGAVVTSYSMDKLLYNETMRDWRTHDGIDIAADAGAAVVAARAGTVESVAADPIMGMTVTIRHEGAWETAYSSLGDAPEVEAGDEVAAGQVIGFVGESAASEAALGPHLHFSVLKDGAPSDPEAFLS